MSTLEYVIFHPKILYGRCRVLHKSQQKVYAKFALGVEFGTKVYSKSILGCRVSYKSLHKVYTKSTQSLHFEESLHKVYTKSTQSRVCVEFV